MKTEETTTLGQAAVSIATHAAIQWLKVNDYKADPATLTECLRANCKIRISKALHMSVRRFYAEFALAGIDAAKEAFIPRD